MKKLGKWLDSVAIGVGLAIGMLTCAQGNLQQCVSAVAVVKNYVNSLEDGVNAASDHQ